MRNRKIESLWLLKLKLDVAHNSFRAALASRVKCQDQVKHTLAGICVSATRMYNFSAGISMEEFLLSENYALAANAIKILLPGRILAGIPEKSFSLGGIPDSTDFSARFLPRYAAGIFPGKDPAGKTGHLGGIPAGSRWAPGIFAGSRRDPGTYFTRVAAVFTPSYAIRQTTKSLSKGGNLNRWVWTG